MKTATFLSTLFLALTTTAIPSPEPVETASVIASFQSTSSLPFGSNAIPQFSLATSFPQPLISDASSIESIRATLALYAFAIDGKNFPALSEVLATNVVANYSAPLGVLTPLSNVIAVIGQSLTCVTTQHSYGTQLIQIKSLTTAFSVTYFRAVHFGRSKLAGEVAEAFGQYQDAWQRQPDGRWKIVNRNLLYMGPVVGNLDVFADC